jgi:15-cis-phytoene desaturase
MVDHITARGGQVLTGKPIRSIDLNDDNSVKCLTLDDGTQATADVYVSAMPVDVLKRLIPSNWSQMPYFCQLKELEGIPVINIQVSGPFHSRPCHACACLLLLPVYCY